MSKKWFEFRAQDEDASIVDIYILDIIGDWLDDLWGFDGVTTAKAFVEELSKLEEAVKTLRVHINSPGGDVFGGLNIANALRDQRVSKGRTVETIVDGLAASSASIIAMAGSPVRMSDNALIMIHDPWSFAIGGSDDLRKEADALDTVRDTIVTTYQWHSELKTDELRALMEAETWMDADEAIAKGFADEKVEGLKAAASINPRALTKLKVPEKYAERVKALVRDDEPEPAPKAPPEPTPEPAAADTAEVVKLCGGAGLDIDFAQALIGEGATTEDVSARIAAEKESRAGAQARDKEIRAVCKVAGLEEFADSYVTGGMAVDQVREQATLITAKLDKVEIDAGLGPDDGTRRKPVIDVREVYAQRNQLRLTEGVK
ncbi:hypothetical protein LCGC14_1424830 [marine sediment metagenome]|uniref:ATP-dependent Clp protease proteolytic subunit n=1 Tax=marine sediment metagenome TaxID=412755 RepID=A0A0F9MS13_9ZZZZ